MRSVLTTLGVISILVMTCASSFEVNVEFKIADGDENKNKVSKFDAHCSNVWAQAIKIIDDCYDGLAKAVNGLDQEKKVKQLLDDAVAKATSLKSDNQIGNMVGGEKLATNCEANTDFFLENFVLQVKNFKNKLGTYKVGPRYQKEIADLFKTDINKWIKSIVPNMKNEIKVSIKSIKFPSFKVDGYAPQPNEVAAYNKSCNLLYQFDKDAPSDFNQLYLNVQNEWYGDALRVNGIPHYVAVESSGSGSSGNEATNIFTKFKNNYATSGFKPFKLWLNDEKAKKLNYIEAMIGRCDVTVMRNGGLALSLYLVDIPKKIIL